MAYTPPAGNAVDFVINDGYTSPSGDAVNFVMSTSATSVTANPYLSLTEETDYYRVNCDGYVWRIYKTSSDYFLRLMEADGTTALSDFYGAVQSSSTSYQTRNDTDRIVSLIENSPLRIVVQVDCNFDSTYGATSTYITGSTGVTYIFYIYPDRLFIDFKWEIGTQLSLDNGSGTSFFNQDLLLTNGGCWYESSGSEVAADYHYDTDCDSDSYLFGSNDEINIQQMISNFSLAGSGTGSALQFTGQDGRINYGIYNGTVPVGTHRFSTCIVFDSAEREDITPTVAWTDRNYVAGNPVVNDSIGYECISAVTSGNSGVTEPGTGSGWTTYWVQCHKYTSTDRLAMGIQYYDIAASTNLPDIVDSTGSFVTDLNLPKTIDSNEAFASDGAYHLDLDPDDHNAKIEFDQTEYNPVVILHDPSVRTGNGSTEHLLVHWKCDSDTLDTYQEDSGTITRNGATFVSGVRGNGVLYDTTDEETYFQCTDGTSIDFDQGTLTFTYQNNGTGLVNLTKFIYHGTGDAQFNFDRYSSSQLRFEMGVDGLIFTPTVDVEDGATHTITLIWEDDFRLVVMDGVVQVVSFATYTKPSSTGNLYIGNNSAGLYYVNGIIDNFKIYDAPIIPYGTFISAQHVEDDDYIDAHSDIVVYVHGDEVQSDSVKIGGGTITANSMAYITGPDGVANSAFNFTGQGIGTDYIRITPSAGVISNTKGKICFWYRHNDTSSSSYATICEHTSASNALRIKVGSSTRFTFSYPDGSAATYQDYSAGFWDDQWHYYEFIYNVDDGYAEMWVDEALSDHVDSSLVAGDFSSGYLVVGNTADGWNRDCGGDIHGFTVTNDINTPQLPFVLGHGPVWVPKILIT